MRSAVLLLAFNRPETTRRVFASIRHARPPRLYVAADGPRDGRLGEREACDEVRRLATNVDWPCDVRTLFRERNLGCRDAVYGGISWFFEHEEEGIILEDDVVPTPEFFTFCEGGLTAYRHDTRVGLVAGFAPRLSSMGRGGRVRFSSYALIWGWATWRRVWLQYDPRLTEWDSVGQTVLASQPHANGLFVHTWTHILNAARNETVDTWDYQLTYLLMRTGMFCVVPGFTLVENGGFGPQATHTKESRPAWFPSPQAGRTAVHSYPEPSRDIRLDQAIGATMYHITLRGRLRHRVLRLLPPALRHWLRLRLWRRAASESKATTAAA